MRKPNTDRAVNAPGRSPGVRLEELPEQTQRALFRSIFGACSQWLVVTSPDNVTGIDDPGQRIAVLRTLRRMTQGDLARRSGVRQADVSKAETDFYNVKLAILESIAKELGTSVEDLRLPCKKPEVTHNE